MAPLPSPPFPLQDTIDGSRARLAVRYDASWGYWIRNPGGGTTARYGLALLVRPTKRMRAIFRRACGDGRANGSLGRGFAYRLCPVEDWQGRFMTSDHAGELRASSRQKLAAQEIAL